MFGKKGQHEVSVKEALQMTAVWIGVSMLLSVVVTKREKELADMH